MNQYTRQGVRNLDAKFGKAKKRALTIPKALVCKHKRTVKNESGSECLECGTHWDWNGIPD